MKIYQFYIFSLFFSIGNFINNYKCSLIIFLILLFEKKINFFLILYIFKSLYIQKIY